MSYILYKDFLTIEVLVKSKFDMEYITGIITLQAIFSIHWAAYCNWYKGTIHDTLIKEYFEGITINFKNDTTITLEGNPVKIKLDSFDNISFFEFNSTRVLPDSMNILQSYNIKQTKRDHIDLFNQNQPGITKITIVLHFRQIIQLTS